MAKLTKLDDIVSLCKRRGFIYQSSEIYGGLASCYDYGPLGVELKRNIKEAWWRDMVTAHEAAIERAPDIGFDTLIVSATTPFDRSDAAALGENTPAVLERYVPGYAEQYRRRGWKMFASIGRVYDNSRARAVLGWNPEYGFGHVIERLARNEDYRSPLAKQVGAKGYHDREFEDGPFPVEETPFIEAGHDR